MRSIASRGEERASLQGLDGYLYELRNAFSLELAMIAARRGGRPVQRNAQRGLFDRFCLLEFETDRLPPDRLEAARRQLRSRAVGRIKALLEAQGEALRLEARDLDALARDWRDAEPVVTLLARLNDPARRGGPSTQAAQLVLHAAKAAAQRSFMSFSSTISALSVNFRSCPRRSARPGGRRARWCASAAERVRTIRRGSKI